MSYAIAFLAGTFITWVILLIVVPIAQKLADFGMPPWPETLWKLAVVAAAYVAVTVALNPVHGFVSEIGGAIVFFFLMVKWFQIDFFGAVIIVVVSGFVRFLLVGVTIAALYALFRLLGAVI